ncbi:HNH endonuclease signature motif containing protein [Microbacterium hominis]|uniref:HNH endonuclease signature motif containing protein n=1 Tax=Microbacterium hominis TaxID=162426 RepID=UPI001F0626F6|nr:HNH endonuclease signature motif containing protein [Microbacterium hominis]
MTGVVDARRRAAAAQAAEARLLADAVGLVAERTALLRQEAQQRGGSVRSSDADLPLREVALELAMALRVSDRGVQRRMSEAYLLTTLFPNTWGVWERGEIDAAHAWAISRTGTVLTAEEDRARYETLALEAARSESPARMSVAAKAIATTIDPAAFTEAAQRAYEERSVRLFPLDDGMARLIADLPAPLAHAIHDTLTARGRAILDQPDEGSDGDADATDADAFGGVDTDVNTRVARGTSGGPCGETLITGPARATDVTCTTAPTPTAAAVKDSRTLAQVRADILTDLLLTATASTRATGAGVEAVTAQIQVTVPALTLAGDPNSGPALLAGYGPIDPAIARWLAALAPGWDRVFIDPTTGIPVAVDRYRPSAELRRFLAARDERCRTPGCTRPAHRCDRDHTTAAADGGHTAPDNLAHLCRRHHTVKHHTGWRVRHLGGGTLQWTSPTGRHYEDHPPSLVRFVPEPTTPADPPPF